MYHHRPLCRRYRLYFCCYYARLCCYSTIIKKSRRGFLWVHIILLVTLFVYFFQRTLFVKRAFALWKLFAVTLAVVLYQFSLHPNVRETNCLNYLFKITPGGSFFDFRSELWNIDKLLREGARFIGPHPRHSDGGGAKSFSEKKNDGAITFPGEKNDGGDNFT